MGSINFFIKDFGCKINQYGSRIVRDNLTPLGYSYSSLEKSSLVIVNTCSVTHRATRKGLKYCRRIKRKYPSKEVLAIGCSTRYAPERFAADDIKIIKQFMYIDNPATGLKNFYGQTRGFINVQQGCKGKCSYCTVRDLKSPFYVKPVDKVNQEIKSMVEIHPEIVLAATNFKQYPYLLELAEMIKKIKGDFRWRLSSIHPECITERLLSVLSGDSRFCAHFHIPVQSASNKILKKMNRCYTVTDIEKSLNYIQSKFNSPGFSYDIITGFPGEEEEDHSKTKKFLKKFCPVKVHIFRYSNRPGTRAAGFKKSVPERVKKRRMTELKKISLKLRGKKFKKAKGTIKEIVPEENKKYGYTRDYMPVKLKEDCFANNRLLKVKITSYSKNSLTGIPAL